MRLLSWEGLCRIVPTLSNIHGSRDIQTKYAPSRPAVWWDGLFEVFVLLHQDRSRARVSVGLSFHRAMTGLTFVILAIAAW